MNTYQQILVAIDVSDEARQVIERAREMAKKNRAELCLLHVVEPVLTENSYDLITSIPVDVQDTLNNQAKEFLQRMQDAFSLSSTPLRVEIGSVKGEILRVAEEIKADLIIVGTHGRHGVGMLLGSTANSVLHGTPCDVLAVRIKATDS